MQRSAISVISLSTDTGCVTRRRSPAASIAPTKARRLSSAMVDGADPAGQQLEAHVRETGRTHAGRERLGLREGLHRLWQVGIGIPMFGHRAPDRREHPAEVEQVGRAQRREARRRELDRKSTRLNSSHGYISYAVFCLKKKKTKEGARRHETQRRR